MDFIKLPTDILIYKILPFVKHSDLKLTNKSNWIRCYNIYLQNISYERSYYRFLMRKNLYFIFDIYFNSLVRDIIILIKKL